MDGMATGRFAAINEHDLQQLLNDKDAKSTQRVVKRSVNIFRDFLENDCQFETFDKPKLNDKLRLFFASIRTKTGVNMKASSIASMKYGLTKYLKERCKVDLQTELEFASSREVYKAVVTDLKKKGHGSVDHKPPISDDDLRKLYTPENVVFNINSPCGLQKKVWLELTYYLCRRGRENQRQMTKSTFAVAKDSQGLDFVYQSIDEADKNHRSHTTPDDTTGKGRMYARPGDVLCPVASFRKYLDKLHPEIHDLWQRPLDSFEENDQVWYYKSPVGKNTLSTMMSEISKIGKLSRVYTNHSIRATTITSLDNAGIEARHIMRASGHKSESSIRSYACRLSENKKRQMSDCLSNMLGPMSDISTGTDMIRDVTLDELNSIFSDDNMLIKVPKIPDDKCSEVSVQPKGASIARHVNGVRDNSQPLSVVNQQLNQIIENPMDFSSHGFQICPTMNNCTVNFNFRTVERKLNIKM